MPQPHYRHQRATPITRQWRSAAAPLLAVAALAGSASTAWTDQNSAAAIAPADETLRLCADCHGSGLGGSAPTGAPNLSVLPSWYVERQLQHYQRGLRTAVYSAAPEGGDPHVLDQESIAAAAAYVASVVARAAAPVLDGDAERGPGLYRTCATCHGERGQGNASFNAPPLAGQNDGYLVRQLESYRAGRRGGAPGDIWGAQMRASTTVLGDDAAVRDVVAYISTFEPRKP